MVAVDMQNRSNSPYPTNDVPVTLPSGTIVHVRNIVRRVEGTWEALAPAND